jgi:hypothetical protein
MDDVKEKLTDREWRERLKLATELFEDLKHQAYLNKEI